MSTCASAVQVGLIDWKLAPLLQNSENLETFVRSVMIGFEKSRVIFELKALYAALKFFFFFQA